MSTPSEQNDGVMKIPHMIKNDLKKRTRGLSPAQMRMLSNIYACIGRQMMKTANEMRCVKRHSVTRN